MLFSHDMLRANEVTASTAFTTWSGGFCPATSKCERMPLMTSRVASSMPASRPLAKYDRADDQVTKNKSSNKTTIMRGTFVQEHHKNLTELTHSTYTSL